MTYDQAISENTVYYVETWDVNAGWPAGDWIKGERLHNSLAMAEHHAGGLALRGERVQIAMETRRVERVVVCGVLAPKLV